MKLQERQGLTKTLSPTAHSLTDGAIHLNSRGVSMSGDTHNITYPPSTLDELFGYLDTESTAWEVNPQAVRIEILE